MPSREVRADEADTVCPSCRGPLAEVEQGLHCVACQQTFSDVAGVRDLRLGSDRYLGLAAERAKAARLHAIEPTVDLMGLANAYYAMTDDVLDERRGRFLRHIAGAEARGEALLECLPSAGRILEVGCGTGGLLAAVARRGRPIVGVDIAARWLVVARRRLTDLGLSATLVAASAESLPWADGSFDVLVADSVLEHLDEPAKALREWVRVLRPGGRLVVWSPNRFTLATDPHVGLWGVGWLPRLWVPTYLKWRGRDVWPPRTLSAAEALRLAEAAGFAQAQAGVPPIPQAWAQTHSRPERALIGAFNVARRARVTRHLLRSVGPLWELHASKQVAA